MRRAGPAGLGGFRRYRGDSILYCDPRSPVRGMEAFALSSFSHGNRSGWPVWQGSGLLPRGSLRELGERPVGNQSLKSVVLSQERGQR